MRIFMSWSGEVSHAVASVLRDWLPAVLPDVVPWISTQDIGKGLRWGSVLAEELSESDCGIVFLTRENVTSPWLNFEAGALAKSMEKGRVFPLLIDLAADELEGPLKDFQVTAFEIDDFTRMLKAINESLDKPIPDDRLLTSIKYAWKSLNSDVLEVMVPDVGEELLDDTTLQHLIGTHQVEGRDLLNAIRGASTFAAAYDAVVELGEDVDTCRGAASRARCRAAFNKLRGRMGLEEFE